MPSAFAISSQACPGFIALISDHKTLSGSNFKLIKVVKGNGPIKFETLEFELRAAATLSCTENEQQWESNVDKRPVTPAPYCIFFTPPFHFWEDFWSSFCWPLCREWTGLSMILRHEGQNEGRQQPLRGSSGVAIRPKSPRRWQAWLAGSCAGSS